MPGCCRTSLLSLLLLLCCTFCRARRDQLRVVIDAGSTGSRIHIYKLSLEAASLPRVQRIGKVLKNHAALAAYSSQPTLAGPSLQALLIYARSQISADAIKETRIHLLATAGLRLLNLEIAEAILDSCRQVLADSNFRFEKSWAAVLPGSSEGIYGFVAANYANGALQKAVEAQSRGLPAPDQEGFVGVLELGGASLQVTFQVEGEDRLSETRRLTVGGLHLDIFTHSFLGFGQDAAQQLAVRLASSRSVTAGPTTQGTDERQLRVLDPCLPREYEAEVAGLQVSGGGYFGLCRQIAAGVVLGNCTALRCALGELFLPPLTGRFLAIENLQYTAGFLGLPHAATIRQILEAANSACSSTWPEMLKKYPTFEPEHLLNYCFGAAYAVALLHDGLGFGMEDTGLLFTDTIVTPTGEAIGLDWTLGAMVLAADAKGASASLDREFPFSTARTEKARNATRGDRQPGLTFAELALIVLGLLIAIAFCFGVSRRSEGRRAWKRRRRRTRAAQRAAPEGDAEEESTDSEAPLTQQAAPWHAVGRRQNVARSGDLEQGILG